MSQVPCNVAISSQRHLIRASITITGRPTNDTWRHLGVCHVMSIDTHAPRRTWHDPHVSLQNGGMEYLSIMHLFIVCGNNDDLTTQSA